MTIELNKVYNADWSFMKKIPSKLVNCGITSPPYYQLRNYNVKGQIGLEDTPEKYIKNLVKVFREFRRILKDDGTLWINIGDSYASSGKNRSERQASAKSGLQGGKSTQLQILKQNSKVTGALKQKDLIGIPWMLAFALRADGWYLRQDIIWHKPNPMPESVIDRCTKSHEYIFMLSKSPKYYYDQASIKTEAKNHADDLRRLNHKKSENKSIATKERNGLRSDKQRGHSRRHEGFNDRWDAMSRHEQIENGANKRSVWTVSTKPFKEAHFATFPPELIEPCIKAGCPRGGVVYDPFMGAGTTAMVSANLGRNFLGTELNPDYCKIAEKRIASLFNTNPIVY